MTLLAFVLHVVLAGSAVAGRAPEPVPRTMPILSTPSALTISSVAPEPLDEFLTTYRSVRSAS